MLNLSDTIVAIATPLGRGAIGIVRLSGRSSHQIFEDVFKRINESMPRPKAFKLVMGTILDGDEALDQVLASFMMCPASYTGEDMIEIYAHGSPFVLNEIVALLKRKGARQAEPGEFTFRAVLNGKMDLAEAESIEDVINAESRVALKLAHQRREGIFSKEINSIRELLVEVMAHTEASIDFSTEDIDIFSNRELGVKLESAQEKITQILNTYAKGSLFDKGISVAIVGRPNVGKSSLLNAILSYDRAIVTDEAGTTRDTIEETYHYQGALFHIVDTAGIRYSQNEIEALGVQRSREKIKEADVVLVVLDSSEALREEDLEILDSIVNRPSVIVLNKSDLEGRVDTKKLSEKFSNPTMCQVSALYKKRVQELKNIIYKKVASEHLNSNALMLTKARHKDALEQSLKYIHVFREGLKEQKSQEFLALDLKAAIDELDRIVGKIDLEDVYDKIFSTFCIGK